MPQHDHKGPGRQHRGQQADHKIDRRVRGQPRILGDAIFGVLVLAVPQIDAAIALVAQPGGNQVPADPGAPRTLEGHAAPHGCHRKADAERREQRQQMGLVPDLAAIAELERIEEVAVPQVEAVLDQELQHRDHDQERDEAPGEPGRGAVPEAARALPEPTEHVMAPEGLQAGIKHGRCPQPCARSPRVVPFHRARWGRHLPADRASFGERTPQDVLARTQVMQGCAHRVAAVEVIRALPAKIGSLLFTKGHLHMPNAGHIPSASRHCVWTPRGKGRVNRFPRAKKSCTNGKLAKRSSKDGSFQT